MRVLAVCTANICRSPVVEQLLTRHLSAQGASVVVRSAGTQGGRLTVHDDTLKAAARASLDLSGHESRPVSRALVMEEGSDLVLAMTREHLRSVVAMEPSAWPRSFTLKEIVRRGSAVGPRDVGESLDAWFRRAADGRRAADLMQPDPMDDLIDPYGGPPKGHIVMVEEVDHLTATLARLITGR